MEWDEGDKPIAVIIISDDVHVQVRDAAEALDPTTHIRTRSGGEVNPNNHESPSVVSGRVRRVRKGLHP